MSRCGSPTDRGDANREVDVDTSFQTTKECAMKAKLVLSAITAIMALCTSAQAQGLLDRMMCRSGCGGCHNDCCGGGNAYTSGTTGDCGDCGCDTGWGCGSGCHRLFGGGRGCGCGCGHRPLFGCHSHNECCDQGCDTGYDQGCCDTGCGGGLFSRCGCGLFGHRHGGCCDTGCGQDQGCCDTGCGHGCRRHCGLLDRIRALGCCHRGCGHDDCGCGYDGGYGGCCGDTAAPGQPTPVPAPSTEPPAPSTAAPATQGTNFYYNNPNQGNFNNTPIQGNFNNTPIQGNQGASNININRIPATPIVDPSAFGNPQNRIYGGSGR